jgi:hypothetical protein
VRNYLSGYKFKELRVLKMLAKELMSYTAGALTKATKAGELIEIEVNDNG